MLDYVLKTKYLLVSFRKDQFTWDVLIFTKKEKKDNIFEFFFKFYTDNNNSMFQISIIVFPFYENELEKNFCWNR